MSIAFDDLAYGALQKEADGSGYRARLIGVADIASVPSECLRYLRDHVESVMGLSEEYGQCQLGWWVEQGPPTEVEELLPGSQQDFGTAVVNALSRLEAATPGTASPGLLAFLRFTEEASYLAVFKLDISERDLYQLASEAEAEGAIRYRQLEDVLPTSTSGVRKVGLVPNPSGNAADLRVLDKEKASEDTATYWLEFLGARVDPPAPKVLKRLLQVTREVLSEQVSDQDTQRGIAKALEDLAAEPRPVRDLVRTAAEESGVSPQQAWEAVNSRGGPTLPEEAVIGPRSLERVLTEIQFRAAGQLVTVRGPAEALEGRYSWEANAAGYTLRIRTDDEPQVKMTSKPGR